MLVELGYKETQVSIPSASDTDFKLSRQLVDTPEAVLDDSWLQAICPCRLDLMKKTMRILKGSKKEILSLYVASNENFLKTVWRLLQREIFNKAAETIRYAKFSQRITLSREEPHGT